MGERTNDYDVLSLEPKFFYGLSTDVKGNAIFANDFELIHPAGKILVIDNMNDGTQSFINVLSSKKEISGITISPNRKFVVVGEKGEKPTLSIFELATKRRLKLLGIPLKGSAARDWASISFMEDNIHLIAVTSKPDWNYLIYHWPKGRVISHGEASINALTVAQVVPNPEDSSMFLLLGPGLFRLMSQSDKIWRQYGFSRADKVPLQVACWLGPQLVLAGSRDGRLLLVAYGELKSVYEADQLIEVHLTETEEEITLASNMVTDDNKSGVHEVRAMISFEKGFVYSCNLGEIYVFAKVTNSRWIKKNVIKISLVSMTSEEYDSVYKINSVTVNPSQNKIVCTSMKTELYISDIFFEQDFRKEPAAKFHLLGAYHDGAIASVSTCLWKPTFLTVGLYDKTIRLWNYEQQKVILQKKFSDVIYSATMHPSGFYCLLGFTDKLRFNVIHWNDLKTAAQVDIRACKNVAFSTGGHLFAATRDTVIEVYSTVFFNRLHVLSGHLGPIKRLVFGLNDKSLWSCGGEGSLYEWDIDTGKRVGDIFTTKNGQFGLTVGEAVYSVGTDGKLKEVMNGVISREIDMQQSSLSCVVLGNSGQLLFLGGQKGTVVSVHYPLVHPPKWQEFSMHSKPVADVIITHDDTKLISTSEDGFLCLWDIICSKEKRSKIIKTIPNLNEILVSSEELEEINGRSKELSDRLMEIEGQHEFTIRQMTTSSDANLRETVCSYSSNIEELKFRLKQMERENLVEINKYQINQKEERNSHQKIMEELEQNFSQKLLSEVKKSEKLEETNKKLKVEFERKIEEIEHHGFNELREILEAKEATIKQKMQQIEELQHVLEKMRTEKDEMEKFLVKKFVGDKEKIEAGHKCKLQDSKNSLKVMIIENGVMNKEILLMRKDIQQLMDLQKSLNKEILSKQKKIDCFVEDIEMLKKELVEKENVINDKDKLILHITKQNDAYNNEIQFGNTTVKALVEKIAPIEKQLQNKEKLLEKRNDDINDILYVITQKDMQIKDLEKKIVVAENTIKKQNLAHTKLKVHLRKIRLELHIAASHAYQPKQLKKKILEISEMYLYKHKGDIECDINAFNESTKQRARMESIIKKLVKRLSLQRPLIKSIYTPHRAVQQLLAEFNQMTSELQEYKRKVDYLQTLINLKQTYSSTKF